MEKIQRKKTLDLEKKEKKEKAKKIASISRK